MPFPNAIRLYLGSSVETNMISNRIYTAGAADMLLHYATKNEVMSCCTENQQVMQDLYVSSRSYKTFVRT